jgi:hypothetical protein
LQSTYAHQPAGDAHNFIFTFPFLFYIDELHRVALNKRRWIFDDFQGKIEGECFNLLRI